MKLFIILQCLLFSLIFQTASCNQPEDNSMVKWKGMNDLNDLVFFFKKGTTYGQKEEFENAILYKRRPDGRGQDHQDGIEDLMIGTIVGDYDGGVVNFSKDATSEQREKLKRAIIESPVVYKVYENVVPNEIKDLDGAMKEEPKTPDARQPKNSKVL